MRDLRITPVGWSLSALLLVTYVLCVLWDLLFPGWAMYRAWQVLFPGFSWSLGGFLIGLIETVVYGFYAAVVFVPVYNYLSRRELEATGTAPPALAPREQH
ncbi:MAG TPA: hypothetical protein DEP84_17445 [Chloroflexi bacterium]|nr:hypothetical protein [Chloroflexota bacterium]